MFTITRTVIAVPALVLALAACGGGSDDASSASSTAAPTTSATGAPGQNGAGGGGFGGNFQEIQTCLTAAGISIPTPSGGVRPSGGARPSGMPGGTPPSGAPGGNGQRRGGMGAMFQDSKVQAALKACGITVPTGRPQARATAS